MKKQLESKLATPAEIRATAKRIKSKTQGFGHVKADKYAKDAQSRLDAFSKKTGV